MSRKRPALVAQDFLLVFDWTGRMTDWSAHYVILHFHTWPMPTPMDQIREDVAELFHRRPSRGTVFLCGSREFGEAIVERLRRHDLEATAMECMVCPGGLCWDVGAEVECSFVEAEGPGFYKVEVCL